MERNTAIAEMDLPTAELISVVAEHDSATGGIALKVRLSKEFVASDVGQILELTIKEGSLHQRALAAAVAEHLQAHGFEASDSVSNFNALINDKESNLYRYLFVIDAIIESQRLPWLLEYWAAKRGKYLISRVPPETKDESEGEAHGG